MWFKNLNNKGEAKWILVVVVKWRHRASVLLTLFNEKMWRKTMHYQSRSWWTMVSNIHALHSTFEPLNTYHEHEHCVVLANYLGSEWSMPEIYSQFYMHDWYRRPILYVLVLVQLGKHRTFSLDRMFYLWNKVLCKTKKKTQTKQNKGLRASFIGI